MPGLTKLMSKLSKEGSYRKALEIFDGLPKLGIAYDTTITNAAISACDKGDFVLLGSPFSMLATSGRETYHACEN